MRLLLDTHAFIWWDSDPTRLPATVLEAVRNPKNELLLSVACLWEIQIKKQLGKLELDVALEEVMQQQRDQNRFEVLPVLAVHVFTLDRLPRHHKDPFDRLLIAQSIVEEATLVSRDEIFAQYPVKLLWQG